MLNKKALAPGPSFWKARFVGAKMVRPFVAGWSFAFSCRPVFSAARSSVENLDGKSEIRLPAGGGGTRRLFSPWMTPFLVNYIGDSHVSITCRYLRVVKGKEETYHIHGDDLAVEVQSHSEDPDADAEALRVVTQGTLLQGSWQSVVRQHATRGVETRDDMVLDELLDELLGRLLVVVGDLLKGLVSGDEQRDVRLRGVQRLHELRVLVYQRRELLGEVRCVDSLVDGQVLRAMVPAGSVARLPISSSISFIVIGRGKEIRDLGFNLDVLETIIEDTSLTFKEVKRIVECILGERAYVPS